VPVPERENKPTNPEISVPLEVRVPNEYREQVGRHMASTVFLDGFTPLKEPGSQYNDVRESMHSKIIEQSAAIEAIISSLDRTEVRSESDRRPIATMAFMGPTGVGKTEAAKALAKALQTDGAKLLRIDCSNYSSGHEVAGLTGSPPGYIGRDQKALLSKENVEGFGTVIVFDEIEKGSTELNNLLLQATEEGELRLNNGEVTSFRDAILIFTSNLGAKEMSSQMGDNKIGFGNREAETDRVALEKIAIKAFEKHFPPELVNRIDKMVVFHPLSADGLAKVLAVKLAEANEQYADNFGVKISLSDATVEHLVDIAKKQPHFGARPMIRAFKDSIQTTFGRHIGTNSVADGTHIRVFHKNDYPDDYVHEPNQDLIFATKPDESVKKKVVPPTTAMQLFTAPVYNHNVVPDPNDGLKSQPDFDPVI